jgi:hypothetical protein
MMTGAYQKNLVIMPSGRKLNDYVAGFSVDNYVRLRMKEGCINTRDIFEEIEVKGYTGGTTQLREFMKPLQSL